MNLRPYQIDLIERSMQSLARHGKVIAQLPTGGGKTVCFCSIIESYVKNGKRVLLLVHRKELIQQAAAKLFKMSINHGYILSGVQPAYSRPVQLASIQTLIRRDMPRNIDLIITDECFPKGTLIDGRPIENIAVGDYVASYNHILNIVEKKKVTRVFSSDAKTLCKLYFTNGKTLVCTPGHPFFDITQNKYIPANQLNELSEFYYEISTTEAMPSMWDNDNATYKARKRNAQKRQGVLFKGLLKRVFKASKFRNNGANKQGLCFAKDERKKSDAEAGNKGKDVTHSTQDRTSPEITGWQWSGNIIATEETCRSSAITNRVRNTDRVIQDDNERPDLLQSRHSRPFRAINNRSRWLQPHIAFSENAGQKTGCNFERIRLAHIEVYEPTSDERFRELCPDGKVYNIEVEDNHNYFADGILVHNCHHATAESYRTIYNAYPNAELLGFTATPCRTNGEGFSEVYNDIVCGPSVKELIQDGYLVEPKIYSAPLHLDLSRVKKTGGDYNDKALSDLLDNAKYLADLHREWEKHAYGKKTVVFAITIEHSKHIVAEYLSKGVPAAHIDGSTPDEERSRILKDFASGKYMILSNVGIVTEGFDVPAIECVQLTRPTESLALYLQMVGRGLRTLDGKERAIILDHANCVFMHGFPQADREWTIKGVRKKPKKTATGEVLVTKVVARDKTGRMFDVNDIPKDARDIELVEIDYSEARLSEMYALMKDVKRRGHKLGAVYYRFCEKYGSPSTFELHLMQNKLGFKQGWLRHALQRHGHSA